MKQQKLSDYKPSYPKKTLKGMTLAAAALLTIGSTLGCRVSRPEPQIDGAISIDDPGIEETLPPEEIRTEGMVSIDEMETPEPPMTTGLPAVTPTPEIEEAPMLMGDVAIIEP